MMINFHFHAPIVLRAAAPVSELIAGVSLASVAAANESDVGSVVRHDVADGAIVIDSKNGLCWDARPTGDSKTWQEATDQARECRLGGFSDWRLPTRFELETILRLDRYNPAIDPDLYPGTKSEAYWTASPFASNPDFAWIVNFNDGYANLSHRNGRCRVRAVRSVARAGQ